MNPPQTHMIRLPRRACAVVVTEWPGYVDLVLTLTAHGAFGDSEALGPWLRAIMAPYEREGWGIFVSHAAADGGFVRGGRGTTP